MGKCGKMWQDVARCMVSIAKCAHLNKLLQNVGWPLWKTTCPDPVWKPVIYNITRYQALWYTHALSVVLSAPRRPFWLVDWRAWSNDTPLMHCWLACLIQWSGIAIVDLRARLVDWRAWSNDTMHWLATGARISSWACTATCHTSWSCTATLTNEIGPPN